MTLLNSEETWYWQEGDFGQSATIIVGQRAWDTYRIVIEPTEDGRVRVGLAVRAGVHRSTRRADATGAPFYLDHTPDSRSICEVDDCLSPATRCELHTDTT